ncbi:MAG: GNAT family N-acetyltransferase [Shimia thalassica]|uniref:GNAT family N-acetyltransferase n=1 Tax=Shimia thalassica TaxID=1715693 RepID=UPI003297EB9C
MSPTITLCHEPPDKDRMNALLGEYYDLMIQRIVDMGGKDPSGDGDAIEEFWQEIDSFLPPKGRLYVARTEDGTFVGCGSLKVMDQTRGELKRLFVKPSMRGTGLGRALVQLRIDAAREMGLTELYVDTVSANVEMRGLYAKLGFEEISGYDGCATAKLLPELLPYLTFYRFTL